MSTFKSFEREKLRTFLTKRKSQDQESHGDNKKGKKHVEKAKKFKGNNNNNSNNKSSFDEKSFDRRNKNKAEIKKLPRDVALAKASRDRLKAAQFRSMNEFLYTHSSSEGRKFMTRDQFVTYHDVYETILRTWPISPVDYVLNYLRDELDLNHSNRHVADMGCGRSAKIARGLPLANVHSFDLIAISDEESGGGGQIIAADICHVPLESRTCDAIVYCLSLMATNVVDALVEGSRVLKSNGHLVIVEVTSRFATCGGHEGFAAAIEKLGFKCKEVKQLDERNDYFTLVTATKTREAVRDRKSWPQIELKACDYKKR